MLSLNVGTIQDYIDMGRFPTTPTLENNEIPVWTMKDLLDAGLCTASSVKHGIKLLGKGKEKLRTPFRLEISRASESAIAAIESIGGEVTTVHYNNLALRALLKPHKFGVQEQASPTKQATQTTNKKAVRQKPKFARPPPKWQPYYTNWENRGYLSVQAQMRKLLFERPELEEKFAKTLNIENDEEEVK
jgi:large subunit ribosomal protein L15